MGQAYFGLSLPLYAFFKINKDGLHVDTLIKLADKLHSGETTSTALIERSLARIEDPAGEGSRIFLKVNKETALSQAKAYDAKRKNGDAVPPLAGIPFSAKDLFDVKGQVTTAGSVVLKDAPAASATAGVVARLEKAGMINIGRANMTEFAYSGLGVNPHYDTPKSIWDRASGGRAPGGSSSGSAVSVADGIVSATIGTDTGGSCRTPAAFNGIVGYKPSCGRMPSNGVYPLSVTFDTPGPFGQTVSCCYIQDQIMGGESDGTALPALKLAKTNDIKLIIPQTVLLDDLDAEVAEAFSKAIVTLSAAGVEIIEKPCAFFKRISERNAVAGIPQYEAFQHHKALISERGDEYDPFVRWRIEAANGITPEMLEETKQMRREFIAEAAGLIEGSTCAFACPTTALLPPKLSDIADIDVFIPTNFKSLRNTAQFNFLDGCSLSLPITPRGDAPVGLMLSMSHGDDEDLFQLSAAVEAVLKFR